jgi:hypothetical protein
MKSASWLFLVLEVLKIPFWQSLLDLVWGLIVIIFCGLSEFGTEFMNYRSKRVESDAPFYSAYCFIGRIDKITTN